MICTNLKKCKQCTEQDGIVVDGLVYCKRKKTWVWPESVACVLFDDTIVF